MAGQGGILGGQAVGHVDHVADSQIFRLNDRGQPAIELLRLKIALAPEHRELLFGQDVDDLAAAQDMQLVQSERAERRIPRKGHRAHGLKALWVLHAYGGLGVLSHALGAEMQLGVHEQEAHRRAIVGTVGLDCAGRLNPGRGRTLADLRVLRLRLGCPPRGCDQRRCDLPHPETPGGMARNPGGPCPI